MQSIFCYQISTSTLDSFLVKVEEGYKCHGNLYHNSTHAADVMQTVHRLVEAAQLEVKYVKRPSYSMAVTFLYLM